MTFPKTKHRLTQENSSAWLACLQAAAVLVSGYESDRVAVDKDIDRRLTGHEMAKSVAQVADQLFEQYLERCRE
jgi:hypothetical protein